jgi:hypothetical protein
MDDRFEATFIVAVTPEEAWRALEHGRPTAPGEPWRLPAFEAPADELEVEPGRSLRVRKAAEPCKGTEIAITLEAAGSGTRITVVQSGFGAAFESAANVLEVGWTHIVADLALFLERGVAGGRHLMPWGGLGCTVRAVPAGLEVTAVHGGTATALGLDRGDILVAVNGAPVVVERELAAVLRAARGRGDVAVTFVRERELVNAVSAAS